jgi:hypothetical protein
VSVGQKREFTTLLTARGSETPLCSSHNTEEKWIRTTHTNIHTILYRLYSTIKREEKLQLSRDIFNKETHMKTRGYFNFNTHQDLQLEDEFLSSFPYRWEIRKKVQTKKMRCP